MLGVLPGSPAAVAGLQPRDILVRIAKDTVRNVAEALAALKPITAGGKIPISLVRGGVASTVVFEARERPREASTEFPIDYRAVAARGGKHRVLVTHPRDSRPHPTVLFVGGIGCYSIDIPSGPSSYRDLAYSLTRRGYTTIRVEKLGVGDSEGGPCIDTDFDVELDGYRQALVQAKSLAAVDTSHVFIFGHSIGGLEGPMLASEGAPVPRISGVAVLSTVGISWYEYELANLRRQLELDQTRPDSIESEMRLKAICGYRLLIERAPRADILGREPRCESHMQYPASDAYMQAVAERGPAEIWRKVSAPALVMYGTSDFITSRDEHQQLVAYINAMHAGNATFADVANLDHYLSRQASQLTSFKDPAPGLARPYYGATLEPILERWLDSLSGVALR